MRWRRLTRWQTLAHWQTVIAQGLPDFFHSTGFTGMPALIFAAFDSARSPSFNPSVTIHLSPCEAAVLTCLVSTLSSAPITIIAPSLLRCTACCGTASGFVDRLLQSCAHKRTRHQHSIRVEALARKVTVPVDSSTVISENSSLPSCG